MKTILFVSFLFVIFANCLCDSDDSAKSFAESHCRSKSTTTYDLTSGEIIKSWETEEGDFEINSQKSISEDKNSCEKDYYNKNITETSYIAKNKDFLQLGGTIIDLNNLNQSKEEPTSLKKCEDWYDGWNYELNFEDKTLIQWEITYVPTSCDCDWEVRWPKAKCGDDDEKS